MLTVGTFLGRELIFPQAEMLFPGNVLLTWIVCGSPLMWERNLWKYHILLVNITLPSYMAFIYCHWKSLYSRAIYRRWIFYFVFHILLSAFTHYLWGSCELFLYWVRRIYKNCCSRFRSGNLLCFAAIDLNHQIE